MATSVKFFEALLDELARIGSEYRSCTVCSDSCEYDDFCKLCKRIPNKCANVINFYCKNYYFTINVDDLGLPLEIRDYVEQEIAPQYIKKAEKKTQCEINIINDIIQNTTDKIICHAVSSNLRMSKGVAPIIVKKFMSRQNFSRKPQTQTVGRLFIDSTSTHTVICLITKYQHFNKPDIGSIASCLLNMRNQFDNIDSKISISMPKICTGLDKMEWNDIVNLLKTTFDDRFIFNVYAPKKENLTISESKKEEIKLIEELCAPKVKELVKKPLLPRPTNLDLSSNKRLKSFKFVVDSPTSCHLEEVLPPKKPVKVQKTIVVTKTDADEEILKYVAPILSNEDILKINKSIKPKYLKVEKCRCYGKKPCIKYIKEFKNYTMQGLYDAVYKLVEESMKSKCTKIYKHPQVHNIAKMYYQNISTKNKIRKEKKYGKRYCKLSSIESYKIMNPAWNEESLHMIGMDSVAVLTQYRKLLNIVQNKKKILIVRKTKEQKIPKYLKAIRFLVDKYRDEIIDDYEPELPEDYDYIDEQVQKREALLLSKFSADEFTNTASVVKPVLDSINKLITSKDFVDVATKAGPYEELRIEDDIVYLKDKKIGPISSTKTKEMFSRWLDLKIDMEIAKLNMPQYQVGPTMLTSVLEDHVRKELKKFIKDPKVMAFLVGQLVSVLINCVNNTTALIDAIKDKKGTIKICQYVLGLFATIFQAISVIILALEFKNKIEQFEAIKEDIKASISMMMVELVPQEYADTIKGFLDLDQVTECPTREEIEKLRHHRIPVLKRILINSTRKLEHDKDMEAILMEDLEEFSREYRRMVIDGECKKFIPHLNIDKTKNIVSGFHDITYDYKKIIDPLSDEFLDPYSISTILKQYECFLYHYGDGDLEEKKPEMTLNLLHAELKQIYLNLNSIIALYMNKPNKNHWDYYLINRINAFLDCLYARKNTVAFVGLDLKIINHQLTPAMLQFVDHLDYREPFEDWVNFTLPTQQAISDIRVDSVISIFAGILACGLGLTDCLRGNDLRTGCQARLIVGRNCVKAVKDTSTEIRDLTADIAFDVFGYAIADRHFIHQRGEKYRDRLNDFLKSPNEAFIHDPTKYFDLTGLLAEIDQFINRLNVKTSELSAAEQSIFSSLKVLLTAADAKVNEIISGYKKTGIRVVPTWFNFFGPSGAGKSTYVAREIIPSLSLESQSSIGPYTIHATDPRGFFYPPYLGQPVCLIEEFLKLGPDDPMIGRMTDIVNSDPMVIEGASIPCKDQMCQFKHVISISNDCIFDLNKQRTTSWTSEVMEAFLARRRAIHVINKNCFLDENNFIGNTYKNLDRQHIGHSETYEELSFVEYKVPQAQNKYEEACILQMRVKEFPHIVPERDNTFMAYEYMPQLNKMRDTGERHDEPQDGFWYNVGSNRGQNYTIYAKFYRPDTLLAEINREYTRNLKDYYNSCIGLLKKHLKSRLDGNPDFHAVCDSFRTDMRLLNFTSQHIEQVIEEKRIELNLPKQQASYGSTRHITLTMFGESGTGKSYSAEFIANEISSVYPQFGKPHLIATSEEADALPPKPCIVILNDILPNDNGRLHMRIVDKIPPGSIIINTTNMRFHYREDKVIKEQATLNNIKSTPFMKKLIAYIAMSMQPIELYYSTDQHGNPYDYYEEGWYRRCGVPGFHVPKAAISTPYKSLKNEFYCSAAWLMFIFLINMSQGLWLIPIMTLALIPVFFFLTLRIDSCTAAYSAPFSPQHENILVRQDERDGFRWAEDGREKPLFSSNTILEMIEKQITGFRVSNDEITVKKHEQKWITSTADVVIRVDKLANLPKFLNNPTSIIGAVGSRSLPSVSLSSKMFKRQFKTCVDEWHVPENTKNIERVVAAAKRTFISLLNIGSDLTVLVECDDFIAYGSGTTIDWWIPNSGETTWHCQQEKIRDVEFVKFYNGQKTFFLDCQSVAHCLRGEKKSLIGRLINFSSGAPISDQYSLSFEEKKLILQLRRDIQKLPYFRNAEIEFPPLMSCETANAEIQNTIDKIRKSQGGLVLNILFGISAVVTIVGGIYGMVKLSSSSKQNDDNIHQRLHHYIINACPQVPVEYREGDNIYTCKVSIKQTNAFEIEVHIKVTGNALPLTIYSDELKNKVRRHVDAYLLNMVKGLTQSDLDKYQHIFLIDSRSDWKKSIVALATYKDNIPQTFDYSFELLDEVEFDGTPFRVRMYLSNGITPSLIRYKEFSLYFDVQDRVFMIADSRTISDKQHTLPKEVIPEFIKTFSYIVDHECREHDWTTVAPQATGASDESSRKRRGDLRNAISYHLKGLKFDRVEGTFTTPENVSWHDIHKSDTQISYHAVKGLTGLNQDKCTTLQANLKRIMKATVIVKNVTHNVSQYGLIVKGRYILTNCHVSLGKIDCKYVAITTDRENNPVTYSLLPVHTDIINDIMVLRAEDSMPQSEDITKLFIVPHDYERLNAFGLFWRPTSEDTQILYANYLSKHSELSKLSFVSMNDEMESFDGKVVDVRFYRSGFIPKPGDCGLPHMMVVGNYKDIRIVGMHTFGKSFSPESWANVITQDQLQYYYSMIEHVSQQSTKEVVDISNPITYDSVDFTLLNENTQKMLKENEIVDVVMDKPYVEIMRKQIPMPFIEWPLFRPNRWHYGEIDDSQTTLIAYSPLFQNFPTKQSKHTPSMFTAYLKNRGIQSPVDNSCQRISEVKDTSMLLSDKSGERHSILFTQASFYNDIIKVSDEMKQLIEETYPGIESQYDQWYPSQEPLKFAEMNECINGYFVRLNEFHKKCERLTLETSPGAYTTIFFGKTDKTSLFEYSENLTQLVSGFKTSEGTPNNNRKLYSWANNEIAKHIQNRFNNKWELAKKGIWYAMPCKASLKDETLKLEKVNKGLTRLFEAGDICELLFEKKLLMPIAALMNKYRHRGSCSIGLDPLKEFRYFYYRLVSFSSYGEAADFKNYDKHILDVLIQKFVKYVRHRYEENWPVNVRKKYSKIWNVLYLGLSQSFSILDGFLVQHGRGVKSGTFATVILNSFCNDYMHACCVIYLIKHYLPPSIKQIYNITPTVKSVYDITLTLNLGDDKTTAIKEYVLEWVNFETMAKVYGTQFGISYTSPDKSNTVYKAKPIKELEYLSRKFNYDEKTKIVYPTLKEASLYGMMFFTTGYTKDIVETTMLNLRKELIYVYPEEKYNQFRHLFNGCINILHHEFGQIHPGLIPLPSFAVSSQEINYNLLNLDQVP